MRPKKGNSNNKKNGYMNLNNQQKSKWKEESMSSNF